MKKKLLSLVLASAMVLSLAACGSSAATTTEAPAETAKTEEAAPAEEATEEAEAPAADASYKIAMITDSGDITDMSFNQTTYEACKAFAEANGADFQYYKPANDSDDDRIAAFNNAVADGYNVVVVPGYLFGSMIVAVADVNPDVTIIALDVSAGDLGDYTLPSNVCCFTYQEELPGYMAGYAAVKEGYTKLGFLGGIAVPAVIRYGYGFVQGANAAAEELGNAADVEVNYVYGGQFFGDEAITATMDTWYQGGTEVVFACGGGIFTSACEAALKVDGKVIGVDVDQSGTIESMYNVPGLCVTSAMKGLAATVNSTLTDVFAGNWAAHAGQVQNLGIVSANSAENYVQLPTDTWSMTNFTVDDYNALVAAMADGSVTVSNDIDNMPATTITVTTFDNIH